MWWYTRHVPIVKKNMVKPTSFLHAHKKIVSIVLIVLFILISGALLFDLLRHNPDFSKSDWFIEQYADDSDTGVKIYWKTWDRYKNGATIEGFKIITINERVPVVQKPKSFKLLPLVVDQRRVRYVISTFSPEEIDIECSAIIDEKGRVVESDGAIIVDWFPVMDFGDSCDGIDWEIEYQNLVVPIDSAVKTDGVEQGYSVEVKENTFLLLNKEVELNRFSYKNTAQENELLFIRPEHTIRINDNLYFYVSPFPYGCMTAEDTTCIEELGRIQKEDELYGGVYSVNLETLEFEEVSSPPPEVLEAFAL